MLYPIELLVQLSFQQGFTSIFSPRPDLPLQPLLQPLSSRKWPGALLPPPAAAKVTHKQRSKSPCPRIIVLRPPTPTSPHPRNQSSQASPTPTSRWGSIRPDTGARR